MTKIKEKYKIEFSSIDGDYDSMEFYNSKGEIVFMVREGEGYFVNKAR